MIVNFSFLFLFYIHLSAQIYNSHLDLIFHPFLYYYIFSYMLFKFPKKTIRFLSYSSLPKSFFCKIEKINKLVLKFFYFDEYFFIQFNRRIVCLFYTIMCTCELNAENTKNQKIWTYIILYLLWFMAIPKKKFNSIKRL